MVSQTGADRVGVAHAASPDLGSPDQAAAGRVSTGQVAGAVALEFAVAVILSLAISGFFSLVIGSEPIEAFLADGPRMLTTGMGIGLIVWALLLIVGLIRKLTSGNGWRVGTSIVSAVVAVVVNLAAVTVIGVTGGRGLSLVVFAIEAGTVFLLAAIVAALIVQVGVFNRKPTAQPVSQT